MNLLFEILILLNSSKIAVANITGTNWLFPYNVINWVKVSLKPEVYSIMLFALFM